MEIESRKNWDALTTENKAKILAENLPQELVEKWAKELAVKWDELTPEDQAKIFAGTLPTSTVKSTITQNQIETTIRLLKEKVSIEYISQVTGLTKEQINAFK